MAFAGMFIVGVVVVFSFIVTSVFMFVPKKNETVHIIFFWLAVALSVFTTFLSATALPSNYTTQIIVAWCGLLFTAAGIIVRMIAGKTNAVANVLVMVSTIYACAGFFLLM